MERAKYETILRRFLPPFAVFMFVAAFYLATFTPSVWYGDSLNFISSGVAWARGEFTLPLHTPLMYAGWMAWISLLPTTHASPLDILQVVLGAKLLGIFFTVAATVALHLVARRLFASEAFAFLVAALFAANPVVWVWGQGAMSDLPALAFMMWSFLFFIRFYQDRNGFDLAVSSVLLALAVFIRIQAMVMLVPYFIGIVSTTFFETLEKSFTANLKMFVRLGMIACVFPAALLVIVYGKPWEYADTGILTAPHASDMLAVIKWQVGRVMGWFWYALACAGLVIGLARRATRTVALMCVAFIAVGVSYYASINSWSPADMPRYLIPTVPFMLLGIGFLWNSVRKPFFHEALWLLMAVYVASIFTAMLPPFPAVLEEPSAAAKVFVLQRFVATDFAKRYTDALPKMTSDLALGRMLPDGAVIIMPGGTFLERHIHMREASHAVRIIAILHHLPEPERFLELSSIPDGAQVFVYPGPDEAAARARLAASGYTPKRDIGAATLFVKSEAVQ